MSRPVALAHRSACLTLNLCSVQSAAMLDRSFILATSAIPLITVVPACLLGLTVGATIIQTARVFPCKQVMQD